MPETTKVSPSVCAMPDEQHEHLHIEIELPGVDKQEINLSMHEDSFTIRARRNDIEYVGSYMVCCPIEYEKARSRYRNGLLTIDVPYRIPKAHGKRIPIE